MYVSTTPYAKITIEVFQEWKKFEKVSTPKWVRNENNQQAKKFVARRRKCVSIEGILTNKRAPKMKFTTGKIKPKIKNMKYEKYMYEAQKETSPIN